MYIRSYRLQSLTCVTCIHRSVGHRSAVTVQLPCSWQIDRSVEALAAGAMYGCAAACQKLKTTCISRATGLILWSALWVSAPRRAAWVHFTFGPLLYVDARSRFDGRAVGIRAAIAATLITCSATLPFTGKQAHILHSVLSPPLLAVYTII
jgi:hypothetical protein